MSRAAALLAGLLACTGAGGVTASEILLFRGEFVFVVPQAISDKMIEIGARASWKHFPALTRHIDTDDDGVDDFVAIAIGNDSGFGVQVRYRLRHDGEEARLGSWYWGAIADDSGRVVFERFNQ